jgi:hypothetical protein
MLSFPFGMFDRRKEALLTGQENTAVGLVPTSLKTRDGSKVKILKIGKEMCILRCTANKASSCSILENSELRKILSGSSLNTHIHCVAYTHELLAQAHSLVNGGENSGFVS